MLTYYGTTFQSILWRSVELVTFHDPSTGLLAHGVRRPGKTFRHRLRRRLRKLQRVAPKGPHAVAPNRTSLRRAIREARQQLRDADLDLHKDQKAAALGLGTLDTTPKA